MIYNQIKPDPILNDFIRCYWWLDNTSSEDLNFTILPDGFFDILIYFEEGMLKRVSLTGLYTKEIKVDIKPNTQLFGIQFRLLALENIIEESIAPILNSEKEISINSWNLNKFSFQDKLQLIEKLNQYFFTKINQQKEIDSRKQNLLKLVNQTKGNKTVEFYSKQVFWSRRQINRYFKKSYGLSLKAYCNILKCAASFNQIKKGELFPKQNYFDRSHFIKELKRYTNSTPKELSKNENDRFLQLSIIKKK